MIHPPPSDFHRALIRGSLQELQALQENGFTQIPKLHWWLLKYEDLYSWCRDNWKNGSCMGELACPHVMDNEEDKFRQFYEELEEVTELHKYGPYFEEQMELLEKVRDDYPALVQWLKQNEKLGTDEFILFWIEWLQEPEVVHPHIIHFKEPEVKFRAADFEHTIRFLEVFNELYWTSDACPPV